MVRTRMYSWVLGLTMALPLAVNAQVGYFERVAPETEGVSSKVLYAMFDSLTSIPDVDIHSVVVLRHGKVLGEIYPTPFAPEYKHTMYSCSKTFVSAAVGLAEADNRLRLSDRIAPYLSEYLPDTVSDRLSSITIRDLLTMNTGIEPDWEMRNHRPDWIHGYLSKPVKETPGSKFMYDSMCTYLLSAIVQKATGKTVLALLQERLFDAMEITDVEWEISPDGYNTGGWGLYIQPESMAKFGQLLLDGGRWNGQQLLPAEWVAQMMTKQADTGIDENYGYQMWLCNYPGAYRADGAYGQYIIIVPGKDLVVVVTECSMVDGNKVRGIIWRNLVDKAGDASLVVGKDYKKLLEKQQSYQFPTVEGKSSCSSVEKRWDGLGAMLKDNQLGWSSVKFHFEKNRLTMEVIDKNGDCSNLNFGYKEWEKTEIEAYPPYSITAEGRYKGLAKNFTAAGSYAWKSGDVLELKLHYVDWISALRLRIKFGNGTLEIESKPNFTNDVEQISGIVPR